MDTTLVLCCPNVDPLCLLCGSNVAPNWYLEVIVDYFGNRLIYDFDMPYRYELETYIINPSC